MKHGHNINFYLDWCEWCGHPRSEIEDFNLTNCAGEVGRQHVRFSEAMEKAKSTFAPVMEKVMDDFGLRETPETTQ